MRRFKSPKKKLNQTHLKRTSAYINATRVPDLSKNAKENFFKGISSQAVKISAEKYQQSLFIAVEYCQ